METFILYIIKVNIAFVVFYLLYKLLFNKDTFLGLRRVLLLSFYIMAWCYPFINLEGLFTLDIITFDATIYPGFIPEFIATSFSGASVDKVNTSSANFSWNNILRYLYLLGTLFLLFRTLLEIINISWKINKSIIASVNGINIRLINGPDQPYSFFKWIFISSNIYSHENDSLKEIIIHEKAHAEQWHSVDILLAQLTIIFCWFNPFVWLLKSEMRLNHEYLADRKVVLSGYNKKKYQYHLIGMQEIPQLAAANLYNNFSVLPLKKRIRMLNRKKTSSIMRSKYLFFIPVVALLIILSNTQVLVAKEILSEIPEFASIIKPEQPKEIEQNPEEDEIFQVVQDMPSFPGGQAALMKYISDNLKYPVTAQEQKIQGRVVINMVVEKDGSLSNFKVARSIDESLDQEAIRILKSMPKWTPGKNNGEVVRVKYTIPVMFRLQ